MNLKKTSIIWGIALIFCSIPNLAYAQPAQLTIADSIRLALTHSPAIKAAEAETAKASWLKMVKQKKHWWNRRSD